MKRYRVGRGVSRKARDHAHVASVKAACGVPAIADAAPWHKSNVSDVNPKFDRARVSGLHEPWAMTVLCADTSVDLDGLGNTSGRG